LRVTGVQTCALPICTYAFQYYNNATTSSAATAVTVTAGQTTSAINASLTLAGQITGTVTNASGTGLANILVIVSDQNGNPINSATTASNGGYDVNGLAAGSYIVEFFDPSGIYAFQYFNNATTSAAATAVAVTAGQTTPAINASLATAGQITGTVTNASGGDLGGIYVTAYQTDGSGGWSYVNDTTTNATGSYNLGGLATGDYKVEFQDYSGTYATQYYNNQPSLAAANDVSVTAGQTTSAINATLLLAAAPTLTALTPTAGPTGTIITLTGTNLTAATAVSFNGTPATSFTVVSDTEISATVPSAATSGPISVTTAAGTATSPASFTVTSSVWPLALAPDQSLTAGQAITSLTGGYRLTMQSDGNLVEYNASGSPLWASGTNGNPGADVVMQGDGNLVVYSSTNSPLWASGTNGNPGAYVSLTSNGSLTIVAANGALLSQLSSSLSATPRQLSASPRATTKATATPTPTATPASSLTPSATPTPSATATSSPTPSATPTPTPTPSSTAPATPTPSSTTTATPAPSATPASSPTPSATASAS
jgi:hypothetical protein